MPNQTTLTAAGRADQLESFVMRDMLLHLFTSRSGDTVTEAKGDGYAPIKLTMVDWSIDGMTATAKAKTFLFTKPIAQGIAGYYCSRPGNGNVIYIEDFVGEDVPYKILRSGEGVSVTAKFKL